ncbi:hypothetical protein Fmac_026084 [Flemingia macrophylla]|uniref:DUF7950 domain-containing protein n=1 Tax=Flemingia macrophylla TaxID=520843 RepID=A0ABD1LDV0_9FABA
MDGRGGCCIARYVPGAGASSRISTVDKIMLRFRPIAPKPVAGATASSGSSSESSLRITTTPKRKYVRDNNNNNNYKRRSRRRRNNVNNASSPVVTLPLLPETPDPKSSPARDPSVQNNHINNKKKLDNNAPVWLSFEKRSVTKVEPYGGWCTCVTVECVTDTWVEGEWLGSTDEERRRKLSKDTCPGFISDGHGRVAWMNEAYIEMLKGPVVVLLGGGAVVPRHPSFTCMVRVVQYACGTERTSLTVPCDVWRMDSGGFAWSLDVKAALSLRLGF